MYYLSTIKSISIYSAKQHPHSHKEHANKSASLALLPDICRYVWV